MTWEFGGWRTELPSIHIRRSQPPMRRLRRDQIQPGAGARLAAAFEQTRPLQLQHQGAQHRSWPGGEENPCTPQEGHHKYHRRRQPPHGVSLDDLSGRLNGIRIKFLESFTHFLLTGRISL